MMDIDELIGFLRHKWLSSGLEGRDDAATYAGCTEALRELQSLREENERLRERLDKCRPKLREMQPPTFDD